MKIPERYIQDRLSRILDLNNIRYKREAHLINHLRIDFFLIDANLGIEVKGIPACPLPMTRQLTNYKSILPVVWLVAGNDRSAGN